ncbi:MAG: response regulator [Gemmatimonadaceae bacterium]|nr:response regulator [Gemmatimonadaceae bacterium]
MSVRQVLVIDDEEDMRVLTTVFLEMDGSFEVKVASSGKEGIAAAESMRPDVILLDFMMPEMDGPETLKALKAGAATAGIPVVFLTAKATDSDPRKWIELGAIGAIAKPFDPGTLASKLANILAETL